MKTEQERIEKMRSALQLLASCGNEVARKVLEETDEQSEAMKACEKYLQSDYEDFLSDKEHTALTSTWKAACRWCAAQFNAPIELTADYRVIKAIQDAIKKITP